MRAMNLADALTAAGHHVTLWSSEFFHQEKIQRGKEFRRVTVSPLLDIRLVPSPGYQRNIGLARLVDHAVLAVNLKRELSHEQIPPDVAFIGYPPIEAAAVMAKWLARRSVPYVLDLKDQWPDIFVDAMPSTARPLGGLLLAPYFYFARRAMREASGLTAMAQGFLEWGRNFSGRSASRWDRVVPLTAPPSRLSDAELAEARNWWNARGVLDDGCPRVCFVGTHSPAFDIEPLADAARYFSSRGRRCEFVICGDGTISPVWRERLAGLPGVVFPGWVNRAQIEVLAERSLAAIAPYKSTFDFMCSIPNKVVDALSLGLPIVSPLDGEVARLIDENHVGIRYGDNVDSRLEEAIEKLIADPIFRRQCATNGLNLYRDRFSYEEVYCGLVRHLELLYESTLTIGSRSDHAE